MVETRWGPGDTSKGWAGEEVTDRFAFRKLRWATRTNSASTVSIRKVSNKGDSLSVFAEKRNSHKERITSLGQDAQDTLKTRKDK